MKKMHCVITVFPDHTHLLFWPETPNTVANISQTAFTQATARSEHFGPVDFEFERGDY